MANEKPEPAENSTSIGRGARDPSLGKFLVEARKRRGFSADDMVRDARIPAHYIRMLESDDYGLIADQIYMLPFLRRYAIYVGLDAEEIAMRFVRDVQKADSNAGRMSDPIPVAEVKANKPTALTAIAAASAVVAVLVIIAAIARSRRSSQPAIPEAASSAASAAQEESTPSAAAPAQPAGPSRSDDAQSRSGNGSD